MVGVGVGVGVGTGDRGRVRAKTASGLGLGPGYRSQVTMIVSLVRVRVRVSRDGAMPVGGVARFARAACASAYGSDLGEGQTREGCMRECLCIGQGQTWG